MKKLIMILSFLLLISCTKEDIPEEDYVTTIVFDNVAVISGNIYATKDYHLKIELECSKNIDKVNYMIDSKDYGNYLFPPYRIKIDTRELDIGIHTLTISFLNDNLHYKFILVDDIPSGYELGTYTLRIKRKGKLIPSPFFLV